MNISCSICAEVFRGPDAHNLHVTRCGHVFHNECLSKWLERYILIIRLQNQMKTIYSMCFNHLFRKNTCPECRSKSTSSTVIRLYVNIVDSTYDENADGPPDLVGLQNENDNLKFRLIEKDGAIKSKEEALTRLQDENKKLNTGHSKSRNVILALEQKLEQNKILQIAHSEQVRKV